MPRASLTLCDRKALTGVLLLRPGIMEGVIQWHPRRGHNDDAGALRREPALPVEFLARSP